MYAVLNVFAASVVALAFAGNPQQEGGVVRVPAKAVPLPTLVTPQMRKVVARPIPPLVPMPTTAAGWKRVQREADGPVGAAVSAFARQAGISIVRVTINGVRCFKITPKAVAPGNESRLIYAVHGGAFVYNGGMAGALAGVILAEVCKTPVISVDYRMPPDHPYPAAPDDVMAVYKALIARTDPGKLAMAGTSAGAGLIMTAMLRMKAANLPKPAALFLGTPGAILTKEGDSVFVNAELDHQLGRYEGRLAESVKIYAPGRDLRDPMLSPYFGDLSGFPPCILISGTRDLFLSATALTHAKLRASGVEADLHVIEGGSHADYLGGFPAPESVRAFAEVAKFFDKRLAR